MPRRFLLAAAVTAAFLVGESIATEEASLVTLSNSWQEGQPVPSDILVFHESEGCLALTTDTAILTAVGNDKDFSVAFVEQLRMLGRKGDIALGISTSGKSANVNRALQTGRELGLLTVGFSGRDGGRMPEFCDYCFTVPSFSIHRIQESHETLLHILWDLIHVIRGEEDVI